MNSKSLIQSFRLLLIVLLALAPLAGQAATDSDVRAFTRAWFASFDRNAPTEEFLERPNDDGLVIAFPEATLRSPSASSSAASVSCTCEAEYNFGPPIASGYKMNVFVNGTFSGTYRFDNGTACESFKARSYECSGHAPVSTDH